MHGIILSFPSFHYSNLDLPSRRFRFPLLYHDFLISILNNVYIFLRNPGYFRNKKDISSYKKALWINNANHIWRVFSKTGKEKGVTSTDPVSLKTSLISLTRSWKGWITVKLPLSTCKTDKDEIFLAHL